MKKVSFNELSLYLELLMMTIFFRNFIWLRNNKINKNINKYSKNKNQGQPLMETLKTNQLKIVQI